MATKRFDFKAILADGELRRKLMVSTIQATQAREGIEISLEQADRAYAVASEAERIAFFSLGRYRARDGGGDDRERVFVRALRQEVLDVRFDVLRRDFRAISGSPLSYQRLGVVAHLFRQFPALEPAVGETVVGAQTSEDGRLVRLWWEVVGIAPRRDREWVPFAKGGEFSRYYSDVQLRVAWDPSRRSFHNWFGRKGREIPRPSGCDHYFREGITWPLAATTFNARRLPSGCIFGHKGPSIFPNAEGARDYLLGLLNSQMALYVLQALSSREEMGGRWEAGVVKRLPVPAGRQENRDRISKLVARIHDLKRLWDAGNETSTVFTAPWVASVTGGSLAERLEAVARTQDQYDRDVQQADSSINEEVYRIYGITDASRSVIEGTLSERQQERVWVQFGDRGRDEARMEHVWRLLSYAVKCVLEADGDGIVSFKSASGEASLGERVRHELGRLWPERDPNQVESEIANELKRSVKGYRRCDGLDEWLDSVYFEYHAALYRGRPIFWHISSSQGSAPFAFGALIHYHRFDKNRMAKLRSTQLRDTVEDLRREVGIADKAGRAEDRTELQSRLEEVQALDKKLQQIQEGHHEGTEGAERDFRILTPWKDTAKRPRGWTPDLDDGVKVNISPFERAGVLRVRGLVG